MKKLLLSMALLLSMGSAMGQTAEKLIAKWKAMPGAQYEVSAGDSIEMASDEEMAANGLSEEDIAFIKKNFKRNEQVTLEVDSIQQEVLNRDIQALKGYELLMVVNENNAPDEEGNLVQQLMNQVMNPQIKVAVYGRVKKKMVDDVLVRCDIDAWDKVALSHIECKIKKDILGKLIQMDGDIVSIEREKDDVVDMKEMVKEVEAGNVLFVIEGEEHPELHSVDEAKAYMDSINFHHNHETYVVGGGVKEKYPHTDKKVVIEWERSEKTEK
ncbi:MAG: hypothetical protein IKH80_06455 [Bacteroidaceae bacterium]|nr:hypothetical protein [Bacteroidaceae bacterium]